MALSVKELLMQTGEKYHLKLLSGRRSLDSVVTWVHMAEDTSVAEYFWGNEMIVTSGIFAQTEEQLIQFIDVMLEKNIVGLVVNVGKYISDVSASVIAYCEERSFPLLTMPWDMPLTEFVRENCSLINKSSRDEDDLASAAIHTIRAPHESGHYQARLAEHFHEEQGFQMLTVYVDVMQPVHPGFMDRRNLLRLHTALRSFPFPYLVFRYQDRYVALLNQKDPETARSAAQQILECIRESLSTVPVQVGIGEPVADFVHLADSFQQALSAGQRAAVMGKDRLWFRDMGFYKLLYSVSDRSILRDYYRETMGPLLDYDRKHNSDYTETLFCYLRRDGSLQQVAEELFTHRNTVNYRMGRIREVLGSPLMTQEERMPYLMAYYVREVIRE